MKTVASGECKLRVRVKAWRVAAAMMLLAVAAPMAFSQEATTQPSGVRATGEFSRHRFERRVTARGGSSVQPGGAAAIPGIVEEVGSRNIFVKGNQRPPLPQDAPAPPRYTGIYSPVPNQLVLTGISLEDRQKVAFLEDQQAYTVTQVKIGDHIADGKVTNMTLDALDYKDAAGRTVRVEVGYNLAGGDVWGVSGSESGSATPEGASTQPASSAPRLPGESMLDYLKRRRAAELGH